MKKDYLDAGLKLEKLMLSELLYIEGARDYRRICCKGKSFKTLDTFGELEKQLPASRFIRVHKSYLVALDKIDSFEKDMITIANRLIPVSDTYKKALLSRMQ